MVGVFDVLDSRPTAVAPITATVLLTIYDSTHEYWLVKDFNEGYKADAYGMDKVRRARHILNVIQRARQGEVERAVRGLSNMNQGLQGRVVQLLAQVADWKIPT